MSTKKDKHSFIERSFTTSENQYYNLNLNQSKKCPILVPVQSNKSKPNNTYENSTEAAAPDLFHDENIEKLKKEKFGSIKAISKQSFADNFKFQNPFEFPRQQSGDQRSEPEVMQFLASQQLIEPIYYGAAWILFALTISSGIWILCGVRKPVATSQKSKPSAAPTPTANSKEQQKTAKEPGSDEKIEKSMINFTPSQQAIIDAELNAALNAEKKDKKDKEDKIAKEKTELHDTKENPAAAAAAPNAKGYDGTPPLSMSKPLSLGMTKADCLKNPDVAGSGKLTPVTSPANKESGKESKDAKKLETAKEKKGEHKIEKALENKHEHEKAADQKHAAAEHKHEKVEPKHDKPPATLIPGKPAAVTPLKAAATTPKATAAADPPDGRSRYVANPKNLLVSAYVKPAGKK